MRKQATASLLHCLLTSTRPVCKDYTPGTDLVMHFDVKFRHEVCSLCPQSQFIVKDQDMANFQE